MNADPIFNITIAALNIETIGQNVARSVEMALAAVGIKARGCGNLIERAWGGEGRIATLDAAGNTTGFIGFAYAPQA